MIKCLEKYLEKPKCKAKKETNAKMFFRYTKIGRTSLIGDPWRTIKELESRGTRVGRVIAMILNGCLTNNKTEFWMSLPLLNNEIKHNYKRKNLNPMNGRDYKLLISELLGQNGGVITQAIPPSRFGKGNDFQAGVYRIILPEILSHIKP
jgi:hypothetical protein